ncbi:NUDIX domain-containing protein [Candidatus Acetothermia bacterium]|nr:NUDIX domain-containing protein [Candidatus Acetothermia bacterium]MBI3643689.1 NUDIX domain-containing protein [Candidatus Acetothermia bacterium]
MTEANDKFTIGAFGVIFNDDGEVLLCHRRDYDMWVLPGGGMNRDETPWECVIREIREETGLEAELVRLTGVYAKPPQENLVFTFLCRAIGGGLSLTDEADQIEYFALDKLLKNTSPKLIERITDACGESGTILKTQSSISYVESMGLIRRDG